MIGDKKVQLDLSEIEDGVYILRLKYSDKIYTKKLIKKSKAIENPITKRPFLNIRIVPPP